MDPFFSETLMAGGPIAILAYIFFYLCRKDRKFSEDRLTKIIEKDQATREEHTKALTEMITLLKRLNGHSL